jgi:hypothetical protein
MQALAKDSEQRYDKASQFAIAMERTACESSKTVHIPLYEEKSWRSYTAQRNLSRPGKVRLVLSINRRAGSQ